MTYECSQRQADRKPLLETPNGAKVGEGLPVLLLHDEHDLYDKGEEADGSAIRIGCFSEVTLSRPTAAASTIHSYGCVEGLPATVYEYRYTQVGVSAPIAPRFPFVPLSYRPIHHIRPSFLSPSY